MGCILTKKLEKLKDYVNLCFVDPTKKLLKSNSNFTDFVHLTPAGIFILAQKIFVEIIKK